MIYVIGLPLLAFAVASGVFYWGINWQSWNNEDKYWAAVEQLENNDITCSQCSYIDWDYDHDDQRGWYIYCKMCGHIRRASGPQ